MQTLPQARLANISFLTPRLAIGGDLAADEDTAVRQVRELVALGVTQIVDVRVEASDEDFVATHAPGVSYLHLGIDDRFGHLVPDDWFDAGVAAIQRALATTDGVVVSHCHMGINRGPSMGLAALLAEGWALGAALDTIRRSRPIAAIGYAEDALDWHHRRLDLPADVRLAERAELQTWREDNGIDVATIIRRIRHLEDRGIDVTPDRYGEIAADE